MEHKSIILDPIGYIESEYKDRKSTPYQGYVNRDGVARIVMRPEYAEGISDLEAGMKITVIFNFHHSKGYKLITPSRMSDRPVGVFSTRSPDRPNSLGVTVVKIMDIVDNIIYISNADMMDGTPVVDIKPYMSECGGD
ncbi:tRNA-Thr(GGU) m(6)t(6)A37 methyltransferase TsaA [Dethiosulfatibacter aminovorans DSM 17477]|uniref:tRNA-Thr(GGU) m(6)t(6)A37 methyltransferase TsaA n=1 Tax=Dethiosulfatibacter aminovorans DSM 17477 TaxID=1121476 RepID=A0A1M6KZG8_9FIRM|nr:tRNA (N6-threonylcarbamoyladenosine(37)-N6)-methyltransferase TrmO [Dethiosulfatibacter aminovorans]SHJ64347.1 tRNA-Thr(GGU) m(6)t(6)A37 methyltransferase TsaA [Dethiosulfatibacter aminovorans DSM 17477]